MDFAALIGAANQLGGKGAGWFAGGDMPDGGNTSHKNVEGCIAEVLLM